jgi:hypothetical protein
MCGTELQGPATVRQLAFLRDLGDGPSSQAGRPIAGQTSRATTLNDLLRKMADIKGPKPIRCKTTYNNDRNVALLSISLACLLRTPFANFLWRRLMGWRIAHLAGKNVDVVIGRLATDSGQQKSQGPTTTHSHTPESPSIGTTSPIHSIAENRTPPDIHLNQPEKPRFIQLKETHTRPTCLSSPTATRAMSSG